MPKKYTKYWIDDYCINAGENLTELELLNIANHHKATEKRYVIDELCSKRGLLIIRILPYLLLLSIQSD